MFLYIKGPVVNDGVGGDYYIDDFSLVEQGLPAVDFSNIDDIVDIGAYEFIDSTFSVGNDDEIIPNIILSPNPANDIVFLYGIDSNSRIDLFDLSGKQYHVSYDYLNSKVISLNVSYLNKGYYFIKLYNFQNNSSTVLKLLKK
jgi:hypothetical protein